MVSALLAVAAAVAIPKWSQSVDKTKAANLQRVVEADVAYLRRACVRQAKPCDLTINPVSNSMVISPALPSTLGNTAGVVSYSDHFAGAKFVSADFNGKQNCKVNLYGELVSDVTGQRLSSALLTIKCGATTRVCDLLQGF